MADNWIVLEGIVEMHRALLTVLGHFKPLVALEVIINADGLLLANDALMEELIGNGS